VVPGTWGGGAIPRLKAIALATCLLALIALASLPSAHAAIVGGPIIDAAVYGNKEFYPGQTAPLLVVVQNEGYLQSLSGFRVDESLINKDSLVVSADAARSSSISGSQSSDLKTSSSSVSQSPGHTENAVASGDTSVTNANSASISEGASRLSSSDYLQSSSGGVGINTAQDVDLEATTALGLVCQLTPGDCPVEVITGDRALVGSLLSGQVGGGPNAFNSLTFGFYQPIEYWIRVNPDAAPGHYLLPLVCTYKQLIDDYQYGSIDGTILRNKNYVERTEVILLDIVIMPRFDLVITDMVTSGMIPGNEGIIVATVSNLGSLPVDDAVAYLLQSTLGPPQDEVNDPLNYQLWNYQGYVMEQPVPVAQYMVVPVQNSQYLGHMEPGESRNVKFTVGISEDAEESDFPLSAVVSYNDPWDQPKSSNIETFGVHVEPEMRFSVDPGPVDIKCGRSCVADVTLTNNGTQVARDAIVRMNALDPFTVSYDTMYLGDVEPGANETARFGIKVKPDAVPGEYYVTLEVKYYDDQDDPHVTKIIRKAIVVLPPQTIIETVTENWPLSVGIALLVIMGIAYMGYRWRGKKRRPPTQRTSPPEEKGRLISDGENSGDQTIQR
jgi:S-layer domain